MNMIAIPSALPFVGVVVVVDMTHLLNYRIITIGILCCIFKIVQSNLCDSVIVPRKVGDILPLVKSYDTHNYTARAPTDTPTSSFKHFQ